VTRISSKDSSVAQVIFDTYREGSDTAVGFSRSQRFSVVNHY
jgi:hypothetical protein